MSDVLAKSIVHRILEPVFRLKEPVRVICRENRWAEAFLVILAVNAVDVILSDAPAGPGTPVRTFKSSTRRVWLGVLRCAPARQVLKTGIPALARRVPGWLPEAIRRSVEH